MNTIDLLAGEKLQLARGDWTVSSYVDLRSEKPFPIFHSGYEPGLVAWPSMWQERDGKLRLSFAEVQGDVYEWPPSYNFGTHHPVVVRHFQSTDAGRSWQDMGWQEEADPLWTINSDPHCIRVLPLADGSLLRICHRCDPNLKHPHRPSVFDVGWEMAGTHPFRSGGPETETVACPQFVNVQQSTDGGQTWNTIFSRADVLAQGGEIPKALRDSILIHNYDWWATGSRVLEDGNVAWMGRVAERCDKDGVFRSTVAVCESCDNGRTWGTPTILLRERGLFHPTVITEEVDFVPLGENRFLVLIRTDTGGNCIQLIVRRDRPGHWSLERKEYSAVPHSGFPFLLRCHDGTILHQGLGGHWSSADEGRHWHYHHTMECYYGQMAEVEPGRVLAVTQVNAGDEAYPHRYDAFLQGCYLTHRKRPQLRQCDVRAEMAFALTDALPADGHLVAQLQCNGCAGLIARADQYTKNYLALVIQCGAGAERFAGKPPAASNLSASLCKVEDGQVHVLAQRLCERNVCPEDFIEAQLTVHGNNLMAGIRLAGGRTTYLSGRDASLPDGQWGVFSDLSKATFRQLYASAQLSTIREGWSHLQ